MSAEDQQIEASLTCSTTAKHLMNLAPADQRTNVQRIMPQVKFEHHKTFANVEEIFRVSCWKSEEKMIQAPAQTRETILINN